MDINSLDINLGVSLKKGDMKFGFNNNSYSCYNCIDDVFHLEKAVT